MLFFLLRRCQAVAAILRLIDFALHDLLSISFNCVAYGSDQDLPCLQPAPKEVPLLSHQGLASSKHSKNIVSQQIHPSHSRGGI